MLDPSKNQDTSLIHRKTETRPSRNISQFLIGRPLPTADAAHETIGQTVGLAVFASDAVSSTAYATQEMLVILAAAGTLAFGLASSALMILYQASVTGLIPLYAMGVFLCFALAQIGMARHWRRSAQLKNESAAVSSAASLKHDNKRALKMIANGFGAVCTAVVTIVVPHFVPENRLHNMLHMQTAEMLRRELLSAPGVVISEVPYQIP